METGLSYLDLSACKRECCRVEKEGEWACRKENHSLIRKVFNPFWRREKEVKCYYLIISNEDRKKLQSTRCELNELQGDSPMILPEVDEQAVSTVISEWTGIPLGRMVKDEITLRMK